jgi:hypothetical protein
MARPRKPLKPTSKKQHSATPPVLLNQSQAAKRWGVSHDTVRRGIERGTIRTVRINKRMMIVVSSVEGPPAA